MLGKLLNHLQPKRKDSTEDWPAFIGSTKKTSHCNASNCLFILNRCLSSCLKSVFSFCLLEFEPQDHQDVGKTSLNMYCLVSPRGGAPRSDTGNHQPPAPLLPPPVDADLPRRVGPGGLLTSEDLHEDQMQPWRLEQDLYRGTGCFWRLLWITAEETGPEGRQRELTWGPTVCQGFI